jgi:hypothetical protein
MLNKILLVIALGFFAGLTRSDAQTAPAASARVKGQIFAARVQGNVQAISKADGSTRVLHDGDKVTDQTQIVTSPGGSVILVFSNGATVNVSADSTLDIEQFEQDPFSGEQKFSEMKTEPGTSTTKLSLTKGELVGKVVHLNVDKGSEFTVETPVGAAGIRGTVFRIVFRPGKNGKAFFVITTASGTVVFRGTTSGPISVPAGKQVVATFDYTAPSGGNPGNTTQSSPVTVTTSDTSPGEEAQISTIVQEFAPANSGVIFNPAGNGGNGGGNGGNGNGGPPPNPDSTPSLPAIPAPATTSGAGSP